MKNQSAINPEKFGTKAAAHYRFEIGADESAIIKLRLTDQEFVGQRQKRAEKYFQRFRANFHARKKEAGRVLRRNYSGQFIH